MFLNSAIFEVNIQATLNVFEQVLNVFETLKAFIAFEYHFNLQKNNYPTLFEKQIHFSTIDTLPCPKIKVTKPMNLKKPLQKLP